MTGPKRTESGEMPTVAVPRDALAPVSSPSIDAALRDFMRSLEDDRPTLVPCPLCAGCGACHGVHMVTPQLAAELGSLEEDDDAPDRT